MKRKTIEYHLKSAVNMLTPDVLDRIDLTTPQEAAPLWQDREGDRQAEIRSFGRRFRAWGAVAAACLCIVVVGNGGYRVYLNQKTDSVIGIDVNPSVELSINRKNKVLKATPLNEDARIIMEEMELEGVDLNIAVNAVIGSMVTHGYLDELDNAILVTVTNDSISKADLLRQEVVEDIEQSLKENEVQAVVYDQQVVEKDEVKELASEYGISYGKAYFLHELIEQNSGLTIEDMEELSGLTMEEIAARITDSAYSLGERTQKQERTESETTTQEESSSIEETTTEEETTEESTEETTVPPETTTQAPVTEPETEVEEEAENRLKIDFADYESGILTVYFTSNVKWKDETVSIRGEGGESYAAMIEETYSDSCEISVKGLEGGKTYRFSIGGLRQKQGGKPMSVSGTFETPMISEEATEEAETTEGETLPEETKPSEIHKEEESRPQESTEGEKMPETSGSLSEGESHQNVTEPSEGQEESTEGTAINPSEDEDLGEGPEDEELSKQEEDGYSQKQEQVSGQAEKPGKQEQDDDRREEEQDSEED